MGADDPRPVRVDGREVTLTHLEKVVYPCGTRKAEVIDYYARVGKAVVNQLRGRPVTLRRFPDGAGEPGFWQKHCPEHRPDWLEIATVTSTSGKRVDYCRIDDLASLVWAVNQGTIEFHSTLHTADCPTRPDWLIFDLDPGDGRDIVDCAELALEIRAELGAAALGAVVKTSGSHGLHIHLPLGKTITYEESSAFARRVAVALEKEYPRLVVSKMKRSLREGRIFVDWSQNNPNKTSVTAYSLRAAAEPQVATPVLWDEVALAVQQRRPSALAFSPAQVIRRLGELGDLMEEATSRQQGEGSLLTAS